MWEWKGFQPVLHTYWGSGIFWLGIFGLGLVHVEGNFFKDTQRKKGQRN